VRRYALRYDDGEHEFIDADGPSEAVANRTVEPLPHTITDLTALESVVARRSVPVDWPNQSVINEDLPLRRFPFAKEVV
jgi:hypothetical protein